MKALGLSAAIGLLIAPQALSACPSIQSSSKWRNSPIVVEGTARCLPRIGRCFVTVGKVLKGSSLLGQPHGELEVAVRPTSADELYCGIEWTPYEDGQFDGRIYLKPSDGGLFTAPFWPDRVENKA